MRYDRTLHLAGQPDENVGAGDASQHVLKRAGVKTTPVEPRDDMQDALIVEASVLHGSPLAVAHALRIGMQECACTVRCTPLCFYAEAGDRAFRGGHAWGRRRASRCAALFADAALRRYMAGVSVPDVEWLDIVFCTWE